MNLEEYKLLTNKISVSPYGIGVAQTWAQLSTVFEDIGRLEITLFIELGVYLGGLSELLIMRQNLVPRFEYMGIEIAREQIHSRMRNHAQITIGSVFDGGIKGQVAQRIQNNSGAVMVYCDNGDKQREMIEYAPLLRKGDYLRAHDYPGETTPEHLDKFSIDFPYMREAEPEKCRELGFTLWGRVA
jgi:hypothetical protein